jgi:hypothetical protein
MDINTLKDKVTNAEQKVAKCEATVEKHKVQLQKKIDKFNKLADKLGYEHYDFYNSFYELNNAITDTSIRDDLVWAYTEVENKEEDIKTAENKVVEAEKVLKNWQEKLNKEEANLQYINNEIPQILIDFLNDWKEHCREYVLTMADKYFEEKQELRDTINTYCWEYIVDNKDKFDYLFNNYPDNFATFNNGINYAQYINSYRDFKEFESIYNVKELNKSLENKYNNYFVQFYISHRQDINALDKELEKEKNNKLLDLMNRVTAITGIITDTTNLKINAKGDIDGIIYGEKGNCKVTTIGAGGYNIQCFHYRVLVKKI